MKLAIDREEIPLTTTPDGVVVVTGTRVSLDLIVGSFVSGSTAEEITQQFPTVALADVYAVITYYLRHRAAVEAYLDQRRALGEQVRAEVERRWPPEGVRERLLARRR